MGSLEGKVALVTGAARGIGQSTALKLAAAGADLALCDLQADWVAETAEKVRALGRRAETFAMNVAVGEDVTRAVGEVEAAFGRIDVLVNNAGITKDGLIMRMSEDDWDSVLDINLKGAFLCTKAVARLMMKQRSGAIVNVASIIGLIGNPGQCNYSASKGGLIAFTKTTAKELAARNIRANAVAPGFISTKMTDALPEDVKKKMLDNIPLKRFGSPDDVANVITFLASDEAAYVSGQVVTVCGGMVT